MQGMGTHTAGASSPNSTPVQPMPLPHLHLDGSTSTVTSELLKFTPKPAPPQQPSPSQVMAPHFATYLLMQNTMGSSLTLSLLPPLIQSISKYHWLYFQNISAV